jgi:pimeloyl-ACP methyl ester carboxylesterase
MALFLFVHGGMAGGWCWKKVRAYLEARNHTVLTPTLTGLGERQHLNRPDIDLETHITDIVNIFFYEELESVILVGHSYGGMVITGVADRLPEKIEQLVYVDAIVPNDGESMFSAIDPSITAYLTKKAQSEGEGWRVPPGPIEVYGFSSQADREWFGLRSSPHPIKSFEQSIRLSGAHKRLKKSFIKCQLDHALDSMLVRAEAGGMMCKLINTGHCPMVTDPELLSETLLSLCEKK